LQWGEKTVFRTSEGLVRVALEQLEVACRKNHLVSQLFLVFVPSLSWQNDSCLKDTNGSTKAFSSVPTRRAPDQLPLIL
jgi:hypothetical protein